MIQGRSATVLRKIGVLLIAVTALLLGPRGARADAPPTRPDIGVEEKLGNTVPRSLILTDERGSRVELDKLLDKPTILTLNYFRCTSLCSPLLNGVAEALQRMGQHPGIDYQVLTVSFDPRDDAKVAAAKRQNYLKQLGPDFPPEAWRFLTGDAETTRRLADAVGFGFAKVDDQYVHPGAIMILAPSGKVTRYMYGTTYLPFDLKMALNEAAAETPSPTIAKFLQFCYSYDPAGRTYIFNVTRITALLTILFAAVFVTALLVRRRHRSAEARTS